MPVAPGDVIRVVHTMMDNNSGQVLNTYHFRNDSGETLDNASVLDDVFDWATDLVGQLDDIQVSALSYATLKVYNVTQDQPVGTIASPGTAGLIATDPMPSGVSALITLDTGKKRTLGKKFFGGLAEAATTSGYFNAGFLLDMADLVQYLYGVQTYNAHEWTPGSWKKLTAAFWPFISAIVRDIPAYQRRRKSGVGS